MTEEIMAYEGPKDLVVHDNSQFSNLLDTAKFNHMWRIAQIFSKTDLVPDHFKKKPENCFVALQMAFRLEVDPMMFLQKSYVVYGRPGIEAQLKIGLVNQRGPFKGPIQWDIERDKTGKITSCKAWAVHAGTDQRCEMEITAEVVRAEGWFGKNGSKWNTIPEKMFRYRSASWLIDTYCPEVTLGLPTVDELLDSGEQIIDVTPTDTTTSSVRSRLAEQKSKAVTPPEPVIADHGPTQSEPEGPTEEELISSARKELRALCKEMKSDPPKDLNEWSLEKLNNGIKEVLRVKTKMQEMQQQEEPPMPEPPGGNHEPFIWTPDADQEKRIVDLLGRLKKDISYGGFIKAVNFYADAAGMGGAKLNGYINTLLSATEIEQNGYIEAILEAQ